MIRSFSVLYGMDKGGGRGGGGGGGGRGGGRGRGGGLLRHTCCATSAATHLLRHTSCGHNCCAIPFAAISAAATSPATHFTPAAATCDVPPLLRWHLLRPTSYHTFYSTPASPHLLNRTYCTRHAAPHQLKPPLLRHIRSASIPTPSFFTRNFIVLIKNL